ncbi:hypothetical protein SADUNF_Sadunf02G0145600 [Salix dunnii]|uniref:Uncharacterized protein n=1 Tax=Salix dunnii TaxID=1413687 RepID=A0A835N7R7_9ROSI|nr:hypothetical protein SADUNF_Sadunf02G0145600 [Salix dunnii]
MDDTESCPEEFASGTEGGTREINNVFTLWNRKNRFVLVWMKSTISEKLKRQLQGLQRGLNCSDFIEHAKGLADQLALVGKPVDEADLISLILGGLNTAYNPFVSNCYFAQLEKSLSLFDFQSELFAFEAFLERQQRSMQIEHNNFAMMAHKLGGGGGRNQKKINRNWKQQRYAATLPTQKFNSGRHPPQQLAAMVA